MRIHAIAPMIPLLAAVSLTTPAVAQSAAPLAGGAVNSGPGQTVFFEPSSGFAEAAVASFAGGAMIGYLAVVATGASSPVGTAALFCGLSVAATTASTVAVWTWHTVTSPFRY